jgi:hypothetical protein
MIWKKFHGWTVRQGSQEYTRLSQISFIIIDSGDDRDPNQEILPLLGQLPQVRQDPLVGYICPPAVPDIIHQFQVKKE